MLTDWLGHHKDEIVFVKDVTDHAHSLTTACGYALLIGQSNAPDLAENLSSCLDLAVLENCRELSAGGSGVWVS
ncbi:uncharacterized protein CTHT_0049060 [Thermochaetoides thermophila DSM 1495]|uniref:Uncharacterized protein n=1 Tax=Chaetomium thermophilum (strain DSM 1495 / CBS 144.50 / IMI 039719) TaxID=759272 RepID=G0SB65_CHATD|nr:hypothetical protein CTHT_0049060 [Thermochaetoides thermophila DSM 1495]EGS19445.1 hypothetical protein CTHT_0049060 [Thermochaetoides thermophila DSM 1495]